MRRAILVLGAIAGLLSACEVSIATPTPPNPTPPFVTATLPVTRTPAGSPTSPATVTPTSSLSITAAPNCTDVAVLMQDVTIPDGTNIDRGARFTKTWQFQNTGTCPWINYRIAFASGDRMDAPDTSPVPDTAPKKNVDVSVDLVAPASDGIYTGFFELQNADGRALAIGTEKTFWVKITVGNASLPTAPAPVSIVPTLAGTLASQKPPGSCTFVTSGSYAGEVVQLINQARTNAGLASLAVSPELMAAAQAHSEDMACYSLRSHTGSDGSSVAQRIAAAGYASSYSLEMIYGGYGAYPQTAFDWWMNDPTHHAVIFNAQVKEIGAGYAYVENSADGNYYTVDLASP
ncbi:MAG: NBR1-Ig-like domain-containing protein [Anaerolineales bacterium]